MTLTRNNFLERFWKKPGKPSRMHSNPILFVNIPSPPHHILNFFMGASTFQNKVIWMFTKFYLSNGMEFELVDGEYKLCK